MIALVNIRESLREYHKAQSWDHSFSKFSLMIYILVLTNQPFVTTLMMIHFTLRVMFQTLSSIGWRRISRKYLNGSMKILWFLIQVNAISSLLDFRMSNPIFLMITLQSKMYQKKIYWAPLLIISISKVIWKVSAKKLIKNSTHLLEQRNSHHSFKAKLSWILSLSLNFHAAL